MNIENLKAVEALTARRAKAIDLRARSIEYYLGREEELVAELKTLGVTA